MAKIEIFTSAQCGYCSRAKALLTSRNLRYTEMDIADAINRSELQRRLPRAKAIPQIFINDDHIGGFEDLEILAHKGDLDTLTTSGERA